MKSTLLSLLVLFCLVSQAQRVEITGSQRPDIQRYDDQLPSDVIFHEGFENASFPSLPTDWTTQGQTSDRFKTGTAGSGNGQTNQNGFWNVPLHGLFAYTNDDVCNCDKSEDILTSPEFNLREQSVVSLRFEAYQDGSAGQQIDVELKNDSGDWVSIYQVPASANWVVHRIGIPDSFLHQNFQFRFRYDDQGNYASGFAVDNIYLYKARTERLAMEEFFTVNGDLQGSGQLYNCIPLRQARAARMRFGARSENDAETGKNLNLSVKVYGSVAFDDTSATYFFGPGEENNVSFSSRVRYNPYNLGSYTLSAVLMTDSLDNDFSDNVASGAFDVVDTVYRRTSMSVDNSIGVWLQDFGDRYGSVFQFYEPDTLRAVKVRIHPSSQAGARFRVKVFNYDTLTSSTFSSNTFTVDASDIGTDLRIPLNIRIRRGRQVVVIEKESGTARLVIGASGEMVAENGNALTRPTGENWRSFSYFPKISLILPPIDSTCPGHVQYSVTDETCVGEEDGSIQTEVVGANSPFTYNWSNGAGNVSSIDDLTPGFYDLFVVDAANCIYEQNFEIKAADTIKFEPLILPDSCGRATGSVDLNVQGGSRPFLITWNGDARPEFETNLDKGSYAIDLTDAEGCEATANVHVPGTDAIGIAFSITNPACQDSNGAVSITPFGTGPFTYAWASGDSTTALDSLSSGVYDVTMTDSIGCTTKGRAFVNDSNAPAATVQNIQHVTCYGQANGAANLTTTGGLAPYGFAWSNGDTTEDISSLAPGRYYLSVTDTAGCRSFNAVQIEEESTPLLVSLNARGNYCQGDSNGIAELIVNGGESPYDYAWSNASTDASLDSLGSGSYHFTVTDANGCVFTDSVVIASGIVFNAEIDSVSWDTSDNFIDENNIYVNVNGGTPPLNYLWNDIIPGKDLIGVPTGSFIFRATDQLGCITGFEYLLENGPAGIGRAPLVNVITIYPNPSRSGETIVITGSSTMRNILICDLQGRIVQRHAVNATTASMDLSRLQPATYLVQVITDSDVFTERILLLR